MAEESSFAGDEVAAAWERHRVRLFEGQRDLSEWIVRHVEPKRGQTILELTAGPGDTGFLAAERIGPGGRLISSDLNEAMVAAARRGAEARGLTNVEFRVIDAQQIDLPDESVDGVLSRFGLMLVPSPERAFPEIRRVLRAGGRLAYGVWGAAERNPWLTQLFRALREHGHAPPSDELAPGGVFSLGQPQVNRERLSAAGFGDVDIEEIAGAQRYTSVDEFWDLQTSVSGLLSGILRPLSEDERGAIKSSLESFVAPYCADDGSLTLPSLALGISAR